ncbi:MAG: CRISPR-associated endonuclease Cas2 [Pyramidobacter sp.]|jgi:CRISPR-associated protein Cas2
MFIIVAYDVSTETAAGRKRLRHVAKCCTVHGQRVQNSVFECSLNAAQLVMLKAQLAEIIDPEHDSIRIYNLGDWYSGKVEHMGIKDSFAPDDNLLL